MLKGMTDAWRSRRTFLSALAAALGGLLISRESSPQGQRTSTGTSGPLRRVVTGFDANGKSTILMDGPPPPRAVYNEAGKFYGYDAWVLSSVPVDSNDSSDPVVNGYEPVPPPTGGVVARITTFVPGYTYPMHKTDTVDFGVVLSGRIEMGVETGTVLLSPGDLIVQRGTLHTWRSVGGPSTVAFILVDAKPRSG